MTSRLTALAVFALGLGLSVSAVATPKSDAADATAPMTVTGRVVDEKGQPVPRAVVLCRQRRPDRTWETITQRVATTEGTFKFTVLATARLRISVSASAGVAEADTEPKPGKTVDLGVLKLRPPKK